MHDPNKIQHLAFFLNTGLFRAETVVKMCLNGTFNVPTLHE